MIGEGREQGVFTHVRASMQIYCSESKHLHKRFIVLDHQYGRGDVIWRWSI